MFACPVLERGADRHEMTRRNPFALRQFILASIRRRVCCVPDLPLAAGGQRT